MVNLKNALIRNTALLAVGVATGSALALPLVLAPSVAQTAKASFPDTQNYWAQPFIAALAERNIVKGYPDGTYRPEESVDRDEFASILQAAFNQPTERRIASGSVYKDVPQGYWAATQIESAYQMGFMSGYPGGYFRPQQPVTKVEALVSLAQNLNLNQGDAGRQQAATPVSPNSPALIQSPVNQSATQTPAQTAPRQRANRRFMIPIAGTMLLQSLNESTAALASVTNQNATSNNQPAATPQSPTNQPATKAAKASTPQRPASVLISQYYDDANRIPQYAVGSVAQATRAGIIVNHPNIRQLNPQQPATRGEIAAIIYQALVNKGQVPPITGTTSASRYIVNVPNMNTSNQDQ